MTDMDKIVNIAALGIAGGIALSAINKIPKQNKKRKKLRLI